MQLAVVCAYPSNLNTGMLTVDLALDSFLARHGIAAEVTLFSPGPDLVLADPASGSRLAYRQLHGWQQLQGFDRVLFWGDFLQARQFHLKDLPWMANDRQMQVTAQQLSELAFDALLLERAPDELLRRTICFGGTIYINTTADFADDRYTAALSRLYGTARLVTTRDPLSAAMAAQLGAAGTTQGVDCAFLLHPHGGLDWRGGGPAAPVLGYSFGRGPAWHRGTARRMQRLVSGLAKAVGATARRDLQWLVADSANPLDGAFRKLRQLRDCALVVTDTYHCAVNAWREGVPAICIGQAAQHAGATLDDKKKELLLGMFGGADFTVFTETLRQWGGIDVTVGRLAPLLQHAPVVTRNIGAATRQAEARLAAALLG